MPRLISRSAVHHDFRHFDATGQGLALELPGVAQLEATFEKLGITDKSVSSSTSVKTGSHEARVFMTLDYLVWAIARRFSTAVTSLAR